MSDYRQPNNSVATASALNGVVPFLKWAGGKRWLAPYLKELIPDSIERYLEPFLGSGAVFFELRPQQSILSDLNRELIETYQAIKNDHELVEHYLNIHRQHHTKKYYYKIRASKPRKPHTRAAKFIYLNRTCWNGLYRVNLRNQFNVPIGTKTSVFLDTDNFSEVSTLLQSATLVASDFEGIINQAQAGDFIFVDPPYTVRHNFNGFVKYNDRLFSWEDQVRLRDAVARAIDRGARALVLNANHNSIKALYRSIGEHRPLPRMSVLAASARYRGSVEELAIRAW